MRQEEIWDRLYSGNPTAWRGRTAVPIPNSGDALDLGCGNGKTVRTLIDSGYRVTGVDFSKVAIAQCRERFKGSDFVVTSVCELPFEDRSFDYVTAVHVLEHLDDGSLARAAEEIRRVLRPSGYVFIRSFTENDMRSERRAASDIYYRFYDVDTVLRAFSGLEAVSAGVREDRTRFGTVRSRVEVLLKL